MSRISPLKAALIISVFLLLLIFSASQSGVFPGDTPISLNFVQKSKTKCTPQAYANGQWVYEPRSNKMAMTSTQDTLQFSGFQGCASSREYDWHLAADKQEQWNRFPAAQSWRWKPSDECEEHLDPLLPGALLKHLAEEGGWLLVGDSVTENHFFSLSCILYPHVIATPNYTGKANFDRSWPQHLYLNPSSPLVSHLSLPNDFSITNTPLVSFRRVDLLFSQQELRDMHKMFHPHIEDPSLFSDEKVWTVKLDEYLNDFLEPLPEANYKTMIVSTGGHWTTTLFSKTLPSGMEGVLLLFEGAMKRWAERVQEAITEHNKKQTWRWGMKQSKKQVVIRPYLPGHEDCHKHDKPWGEVQPFVWNWFNWGEIWRFNWSFEKLLAQRKEFPNIHYIGIDRPARLRPDAHATGDCLHIMTGAGVLEGWTHYIWHYITHL